MCLNAAFISLRADKSSTGVYRFKMNPRIKSNCNWAEARQSCKLSVWTQLLCLCSAALHMLRGDRYRVGEDFCAAFGDFTCITKGKKAAGLTTEGSEGWSVWVVCCQQQLWCCLMWLDLSWSISKLRTSISFPLMSTNLSWTVEREVCVYVGVHFHFDCSFFSALKLVEFLKHWFDCF